MNAPKRKSWQGAAVVQEIHDGDTFRAQIDLGFRISFHAPVRIFGINAPEMNTAQGIQARTFLLTQLQPGDVVTLDSKRLDLHGRAEAVVTLPDGRDLATVMLNAGQAQPANDRGNT
jgi:endonuclease YncB( thermonuclease family)